MATLQTTESSANRRFDDIWQFLDHEDPDYQTLDQVHERVRIEPSREFLKPAPFGLRSSLQALDTIRHGDDIQLPTFSQKYGGNIQPMSQLRMPRTSVDGNPSVLYAMPNKVKRPTSDTESLSSAEYPGTSGNLVKRYENGSILSTVSSDHPPVVFHDNEMLIKTDSNGASRTQLPEYAAEGNNVFTTMHEKHPRPWKRWMKKANGTVHRRAKCCSEKTIVVLVVGVIVVMALLSIALGVYFSIRMKSTVKESPVCLQGSLKFFGMNYSSVYSNASSETALNATKSICSAFEVCLFNLSQNGASFQNCVVLSYSDGSLVANFQLLLLNKNDMTGDALVNLTVAFLNKDFNASNSLFRSIFPSVNRVTLINNSLIITSVSTAKPFAVDAFASTSSVVVYSTNNRINSVTETMPSQQHTEHEQIYRRISLNTSTALSDLPNSSYTTGISSNTTPPLSYLPNHSYTTGSSSNTSTPLSDLRNRSYTSDILLGNTTFRTHSSSYNDSASTVAFSVTTSSKINMTTSLSFIFTTSPSPNESKLNESTSIVSNSSGDTTSFNRIASSSSSAASNTSHETSTVSLNASITLNASNISHKTSTVSLNISTPSKTITQGDISMSIFNTSYPSVSDYKKYQTSTMPFYSSLNVSSSAIHAVHSVTRGSENSQD